LSKDIVIRFLLDGVIVSLFAVLGDLFRPKSFAGLFGAAPSVALATLALLGNGFRAGLDYPQESLRIAPMVSCSII
jgi:hypothetical protein